MQRSDYPHIDQLDKLLQTLPAQEQERFSRIYHLSISEAELIPPAMMIPWLTETFGQPGESSAQTLERVRRQRVVKITNRFTLETTLFNPLRAQRPIMVNALGGEGTPADLSHLLEASRGDDFCAPLSFTPADPFGRLESEHSVTASNIAKIDRYHGLVIFREHNLLRLDHEAIADALQLALRWLHRAHAEDPTACYPLIFWNSLWKSGASHLHAHIQIVLSKGIAYGRIEQWRRAAETYHRRWGESYFDTLIRVHRSLGLSHNHGEIALLAHLTPVKEREIVIIAPAANEALFQLVGQVLIRYTSTLGAWAFNLAIYLPPLGPTPEDWSTFPAIVRIVDRGHPFSRSVDIGAIELFAASAVSSDPFSLADALRSSTLP